MVVGVSNLNIVNSAFVSVGIYLKLNNLTAFIYFQTCFFYMLSMHSLNFFIYFFFNRLFRLILIQTLKDLKVLILTKLKLTRKPQVEQAEDYNLYQF